MACVYIVVMMVVEEEFENLERMECINAGGRRRANNQNLWGWNVIVEDGRIRSGAGCRLGA